MIKQRQSDITNLKLPKLEKPIILTVARHEGRKAINKLLYAYQILNARNIAFSALIIGDGKLFLAHKRLAEHLKLKNVYMPGSFPGTRPFMKMADIFAFAATGEGSSVLVILEAMKYGLPIVSTACDGIPEDIEHEKSGLLVPLNNPEKLADAIERLLRNKKLATRLGKAAQKRYQKKYHLKKVKKETKELLDKIYGI